MPRPKRTKVAPSAPAPRTRKVREDTIVDDIAPQPPKAVFDDLYDMGDQEERIVKSARHVKKGNSKSKLEVSRPQRLAILDALGSASKRNNRQELAEGSNSVLTAPEDNADDNLLDDIELGSSSPEVEVGRRDMNTPMGNSTLGFGNFRRRARQPSILGHRAGRARSSSVESNLAEDNGLTSVGRTNTSALATGNFKRQPRQSSMLGGTNTNVAPSSMALEMDRGTPAQVGSALKFGNFKRRAREPSILGTAQKKRQPRPDSNKDSDEDEDDDFNPEDQSTPLNLSKTRTTISSSAGSVSNPRKRKLSVVQVPQSNPSSSSHSVDDPEETVPATKNLSEDEQEEEQASSLAEDEGPVPSIEAPPISPEPMSETMAPPLSSSSVASSPEPPLPACRPASRGRRLRGRTPPPRTQDSPISSPPSLTHSPNYIRAPKPRAQRERPVPSTYSTAQLQALLPRRRRRGPRDPFDIPSSDGEVDASGLASEDDELSHLNARARRQRSVLSRTPAPLRKPTKAKLPKSTAKAPKRTYASRVQATSDKENEEVDLDDSLGPILDDGNVSPENSQELEKRVGKELKRAARKFQDIDKWELEFEDVTASSSSPKDAR